MESSDERTEPASAEKLRRARAEGRVAKSRDVVGAFGFASAGLALAVTGPDVALHLRDACIRALEHPHPEPLDLGPKLLGGLLDLATSCGPVAAAAIVAVVASTLLQTGPVFAPRAVAPKAERVDPSRGLRRLFASEKAFELAKSCMQVTVAGVLAAMTTKEHAADLARLGRSSLDGGVHVTARILGTFALRLTSFFLVIAAVDGWWSRRSFARRMRMTKSEARRDAKQTEGDPQIAGRRREMARELLLTGRVSDVPKAAVVVVNPVRLAIAIAYASGESAPRILVKGRGPRARDIRSQALLANVPIATHRPLARALHGVPVGDEVPEAWWEALADVLAVVGHPAAVTPSAE